MATLSVQEAMGFKVDREAVATLVLPQLWAMSIGPCTFRLIDLSLESNTISVLSVGQFQRFMQVIKKLGDRVEQEHNQFLRDSQRLEDRSGVASDDMAQGSGNTRSVDFESLVGQASNPITVKADTVLENNTNWDDDVWGSILNNNMASVLTVTLKMCVDQSHRAPRLNNLLHQPSYNQDHKFDLLCNFLHFPTTLRGTALTKATIHNSIRHRSHHILLRLPLNGARNLWHHPRHQIPLCHIHLTHGVLSRHPQNHRHQQSLHLKRQWHQQSFLLRITTYIHPTKLVHHLPILLYPMHQLSRRLLIQHSRRYHSRLLEAQSCYPNPRKWVV